MVNIFPVCQKCCTDQIVNELFSLAALWRGTLWRMLCRVRAYIQMKMVASYMGHMLMVNSMALLRSLMESDVWCFGVSTKRTIAVENAGYSTP